MGLGDYISAVGFTIGPHHSAQSGLAAPVTVTWTRGPLAYDVVQVYLAPVASGTGSAHLVTTAQADGPDHVTIDLAQGWWNLTLAPRLLDGESVRSVMKDLNGMDQSFDAFDHVIVVNVPGVTASSRPRKAAPSITGVQAIGSGRVVVEVRWTASQPFQFYQIRWSEKGRPATEVRLSPGDDSFQLDAQHVYSGATYVFIVQGCDSVTFGSKCSPWSLPAEVTVAVGTSTEPVRGQTARAEGWNGIRLGWINPGSLDALTLRAAARNAAAEESISLDPNSTGWLDTSWLPGLLIDYSIESRVGRFEPSNALVSATTPPHRASSPLVTTRRSNSSPYLALPHGRDSHVVQVLEQSSLVAGPPEALPRRTATTTSAPAAEEVIDAQLVQPSLHREGSLDCVVRLRDSRTASDRLAFAYRHPFGVYEPSQPWSMPQQIVADGAPIEGVTGGFALLAGAYGPNGNYELLVPIGEAVAHFWRDNSAAGLPWHRAPDVWTSGSGDSAMQRVERVFPVGVSAVQTSDEAGAGPLECFIRMEPVLPSSTPWLIHRAFDIGLGSWSDPRPVSDGAGPITGVTADPALLCMAPGALEMLLVLGDQVVHYRRPARATTWQRSAVVGDWSPTSGLFERRLPGRPVAVWATCLGARWPGSMLAIVRVAGPEALTSEGGDTLHCFTAQMPGDESAPSWVARGPLLAAATSEPLRLG